MPHQLRHCTPNDVIEVRFSCQGGRPNCAPTRGLTDELKGRIWRACQLYPQVRVHCGVQRADGGCLMLSAPDAPALNTWVGYLERNTTTLSQRTFGHDERLFVRPYRSAHVLDEQAVAERVRAMFAELTEAELVARPGDWPGFTTIDANCRGASILGRYVDTIVRGRAVTLGVPATSIAPTVTLKIEPFPFMNDWPAHHRQRWFQAIERRVIKGARDRRPRRPLPPVSALRTRAFYAECKLRPQQMPRCFASSRIAEQAYLDRRRRFVREWYTARARLIAGTAVHDCGFPPGGWVLLCHPPPASTEPELVRRE